MYIFVHNTILSSVSKFTFCKRFQSYALDFNRNFKYYNIDILAEFLDFPAVQNVCSVHFHLLNETMLIAIQCSKFATDSSSIEMNHTIRMWVIYAHIFSWKSYS